ncbi:unnamed protein product, partial [Meganyctiphanes norvegica]
MDQPNEMHTEKSNDVEQTIKHQTFEISDKYSITPIAKEESLLSKEEDMIKVPISKKKGPQRSYIQTKAVENKVKNKQPIMNRESARIHSNTIVDKDNWSLDQEKEANKNIKETRINKTEKNESENNVDPRKESRKEQTRQHMPKRIPNQKVIDEFINMESIESPINSGYTFIENTKGSIQDQNNMYIKEEQHCQRSLSDEKPLIEKEKNKNKIELSESMVKPTKNIKMVSENKTENIEETKLSKHTGSSSKIIKRVSFKDPKKDDQIKELESNKTEKINENATFCEQNTTDQLKQSRKDKLQRGEETFPNRNYNEIKLEEMRKNKCKPKQTETDVTQELIMPEKMSKTGK